MRPALGCVPTAGWTPWGTFVAATASLALLPGLRAHGLMPVAAVGRCGALRTGATRVSRGPCSSRGAPGTAGGRPWYGSVAE